MADDSAVQWVVVKVVLTVALGATTADGKVVRLVESSAVLRAFSKAVSKADL